MNAKIATISILLFISLVFAVNAAPRVLPVWYTGDCSNGKEMTVYCDVQVDTPDSETFARIWAGQCSSSDCFNTRSWKVGSSYANGKNAELTSGTTYKKTFIVNQPAGTGIAATCKAFKTDSESNWGDRYPLCIVGGCKDTPLLTITSPGHTDSFKTGDQIVIRFSSNKPLKEDPVVTVKPDSQRDGSRTYSPEKISGTLSTPDYVYTITVDDSFAGGTADVVVSAVAADGCKVTQIEQFNVAGGAPQLPNAPVVCWPSPGWNKVCWANYTGGTVPDPVMLGSKDFMYTLKIFNGYQPNWSYDGFDIMSCRTSSYSFCNMAHCATNRTAPFVKCYWNATQAPARWEYVDAWYENNTFFVEENRPMNSNPAMFVLHYGSYGPDGVFRHIHANNSVYWGANDIWAILVNVTDPVVTINATRKTDNNVNVLAKYSNELLQPGYRYNISCDKKNSKNLSGWTGHVTLETPAGPQSDGIMQSSVIVTQATDFSINCTATIPGDSYNGYVQWMSIVTTRANATTTIPVCGNGICEAGEANNCPVCTTRPCPAMPCRQGTCPADCGQPAVPSTATSVICWPSPGWNKVCWANYTGGTVLDPVMLGSKDFTYTLKIYNGYQPNLSYDSIDLMSYRSLSPGCSIFSCFTYAIPGHCSTSKTGPPVTCWWYTDMSHPSVPTYVDARYENNTFFIKDVRHMDTNPGALGVLYNSYGPDGVPRVIRANNSFSMIYNTWWSFLVNVTNPSVTIDVTRKADNTVDVLARYSSELLVPGQGYAYDVSCDKKNSKNLPGWMGHVTLENSAGPQSNGIMQANVAITETTDFSINCTATIPAWPWGGQVFWTSVIPTSANATATMMPICGNGICEADEVRCPVCVTPPHCPMMPCVITCPADCSGPSAPTGNVVEPGLVEKLLDRVHEVFGI